MAARLLGTGAGERRDAGGVALQCGDGSLITLELDALVLENGARQFFLREMGVRDRAA